MEAIITQDGQVFFVGAGTYLFDETGKPDKDGEREFVIYADSGTEDGTRVICATFDVEWEMCLAMGAFRKAVTTGGRVFDFGE